MRFLSLIVLTFISHIVFSQNTMWVVSPQYDHISAFYEDIAAVQKSGKWGYINKDGDIIAECKYDMVYPFSDGFGVATSLDDTIVAIIDKNGTRIERFQNSSGQTQSYKVDPRFAQYGSGLLLVTDGSTAQLYDKRRYKMWGYINTKGILQIDIKYFGALPFSDGLAGVAYENLRYAYITPSGSVAITNDFNKGTTIGAMGFYQGKSIVVGEKGLTYIDSRGKKSSESVIKFTPLENFYNTTSSFIRGEEGNLEFDSKGRITSLTNRQGETIQIRDELRSEPLSVIKIQRGVSISNKLKSGESYVAQFEGKMGLIIAKTLSLNVKLSNSIVEANGNSPIYAQFEIENNESSGLKGLDIYCNNSLVASNMDVSNRLGYFKVTLPKSTNVSSEDVELNIRIESKGLELLSQRYKVTVRNKPVSNNGADVSPDNAKVTDSKPITTTVATATIESKEEEEEEEIVKLPTTESIVNPSKNESV